MPIPLVRTALQPLIDQALGPVQRRSNDVRTNPPHAGLLLSRGMRAWSDEGNQTGAAKKQLIDAVCGLRPSKLYLQALKRWKTLTSHHLRFASFEATLCGRLYIGVTRENALETGVTTSHSYGMPIIPGSALKGLARHTARRLEIAADAQRWLFGPENPDEDDAESGGVIFHDAWWVGTENDYPFVAEVVTPHHADYYGSQGQRPATDFDSPIPAPQIAVTGRFYFVVESPHIEWATFARTLLQSGLQQSGIGGKRSSGYGYFRLDGSPPR